MAFPSLMCAKNKENPPNVVLSNKNSMSHLLAASWSRRHLFGSLQRKAASCVLFCACDVDHRASLQPFENAPSTLNSHVHLFQGKPAMSLKGISCRCTLCVGSVESQVTHLLTEFFFILVLSEKTPERSQTILIPRFELPLSTLGKKKLNITAYCYLANFMHA